MPTHPPKKNPRQLVLLVEPHKEPIKPPDPPTEIAVKSPRTIRMSTATLQQKLEELVAPALRSAVTARLLEASVPPDNGEDGSALPEALPEGWPIDVSAQTLLEWLEKHAHNKERAEAIQAAVKASPRFVFTSRPLPPPPKKRSRGTSIPETASSPTSTVPVSDEDVLFAAWTCHVWLAIERDRQRPAIAIDAGRQHHDLLTLHRKQPKNERSVVADVYAHRYVIRSPELNTQLAIVRSEAHTALLEAFRDWKEWHGLRVWAALLWLATKAGRTGFLRWRVDDHLAALGYSERACRDPELRQRLISEVGTLTETIIEVYDSSGKLQLKDTVLRVGIQASVLRDGKWELEGMELQISPLLYRGVRQVNASNKPGEIGVLWYPAPIELAQIDANHFPHALSLGFILPIRWRWDLGERDHIALKGENLLEIAGISIHDRNTARAMNAAKRNLDELVRIGGLGKYEWSEDEEWTLNGICRLYPPAWTVDRTLHGIEPAEPTPTTPYRSGKDLLNWRKKRGFTQVEAAKTLGVSDRTIRTAEAKPEATLTKTLRKMLEETDQKKV